jgi:hypothetical protein
MLSVRFRRQRFVRNSKTNRRQRAGKRGTVHAGNWALGRQQEVGVGRAFVMKTRTTPMKKLLVLGFLGLVALHTSAQKASAWCLFKNHCCCKFNTTLCIKPYNAFSPVAYGNIVGEGCMPVNVFGGYGGGQQGPGCAPCYGGACSGPGCVVGGGYIPSGVHTTPGVARGMVMPTAPQNVTPTAYSGVMPIGYQTMYNPYMNVGLFGQQPVQAPSYWYGR